MTNPENVAPWPKPQRIGRAEAIRILEQKKRNILYVQMPRIRRLKHDRGWSLARKIQVLAALFREVEAYDMSIKAILKGRSVMMKLEAFVDDSKIAKVLHALNGLVVQMSVGPVANAKAGKQGVVGKGQPTSGREVVSQIINKALADKKATIERKDVTALAVSIGIPPARAYAALQAMQKEKVIKLSGNGTFKINNPVLKVEKETK